jgi:hypothetical protein
VYSCGQSTISSGTPPGSLPARIWLAGISPSAGSEATRPFDFTPSITAG